MRPARENLLRRGNAENRQKFSLRILEPPKISIDKSDIENLNIK